MDILPCISLHNTLRHESDVLYLRDEIEQTMLALLKHVRLSVRTMDVYELSLLVDVCLVAVLSEEIPKQCELRSKSDHGTRLDVEVAGIIPCSYRKTRDMLVRLVLGICLVTHPVTVMHRDIERCLESIVHIRTAVPYPVAFLHFHMVHLSRKPYVHCSVPLVTIHILRDREYI